MDFFRNVISIFWPVKAGSFVSFLGQEGDVGSNWSNKRSLVLFYIQLLKLRVDGLKLIELTVHDHRASLVK